MIKEVLKREIIEMIEGINDVKILRKIKFMIIGLKGIIKIK